MRILCLMFSIVVIALLAVIAYQAIRIRTMGIILSQASVSTVVRPQPAVRGDMAAQLAAALQENRTLRQVSRTQSNGPSSIGARVEALKDLLTRLPDQQIPQLAYACFCGRKVREDTAASSPCVSRCKWRSIPPRRGKSAFRRACRFTRIAALQDC